LFCFFPKFCLALLIVSVFAEKDASKAAENERVKKAVVIPPPGSGKFVYVYIYIYIYI